MYIFIERLLSFNVIKNMSLIYLVCLMQVFNNCEIANTQFKEDLKNNELQYFTFGIFPVADEVKKEYEKCCSVEIIRASCVSSDYYKCYNKLVGNYIFKKTGKNISL